MYVFLSTAFGRFSVSFVSLYLLTRQGCVFACRLAKLLQGAVSFAQNCISNSINKPIYLFLAGTAYIAGRAQLRSTRRRWYPDCGKLQTLP